MPGMKTPMLLIVGFEAACADYRWPGTVIGCAQADPASAVGDAHYVLIAEDPHWTWRDCPFGRSHIPTAASVRYPYRSKVAEHPAWIRVPVAPVDPMERMRPYRSKRAISAGRSRRSHVQGTAAACQSTAFPSYPWRTDQRIAAHAHMRNYAVARSYPLALTWGTCHIGPAYHSTPVDVEAHLDRMAVAKHCSSRLAGGIETHRPVRNFAGIAKRSDRDHRLLRVVLDLVHVLAPVRVPARQDHRIQALPLDSGIYVPAPGRTLLLAVRASFGSKVRLQM